MKWFMKMENIIFPSLINFSIRRNGKKKKEADIITNEDFAYEYEKFYLNLMKESKTNLYIRAGEIDCKRNFFLYLKNKDGLPEEGTAWCQAMEAADRFYLFFLDNYGEKMRTLYDNAAAEWIRESFGELPDTGVV